MLFLFFKIVWYLFFKIGLEVKVLKLINLFFRILVRSLVDIRVLMGRFGEINSVLGNVGFIVGKLFDSFFWNWLIVFWIIDWLRLFVEILIVGIFDILLVLVVLIVIGFLELRL